MHGKRSTPASRAANKAAKARSRAELAELRANPPPDTFGPPAQLATLGAWAARAGRQSLLSKLANASAAGSESPPQAGSGAAGAGLDPSSTSHTQNDESIPETLKTRLRRMRQGVVTAARLMQEDLQQGGRRYRAAMVGVTYRPGVEPRARHLSALQNHYRNWLARRGEELRCVWVAEMQKRGVIHYHLLLFLPRGLTPPKPDKQGWWPHGSSNCKWAQKPVGYLVKYTSKAESKCQLPKGSRMWGCAGLRGTRRDHLRWWLAPGWLRELVPLGDVLRRVGRWWENRTAGIAYRSPYTLLDYVNGRMVFAGPDWTEDHVRFFDAA